MPALAAALLLATLVVSACTGPAPVPLPVASPSPALPRTAPAPTPDPARLAFETLDRAEFMGYEKITQGQTLVAWAANEAGGLAALVVPDARANLLATDFATHFLIGVFRGTERGTNYPVTIRQIRYEGGTITVHADFGSPGRGASGASLTNPYHVVRVQRPLQMQGRPVVLRITQVTPTPPAIVVTGTAHDPARLAFETLDRGEFMDRIDLVRVSEGQVIAAWSADQAAGLATHVIPDARANLLATDFATHFLLGVFRGTERGTNYPVTIQQIRYEGGTITVHADFGSPGRGPSGALGTDPYHVVRVQRPPQMPGQPPVVLRITRVTPTPPGGPPPTIAVTGTPYDPPLPQSPKIHPSLAQQWAVTGPTEQLRLYVGVVGVDRPRSELFHPIIAERYPEARASLAERGSPYPMDNLPLARRIGQEMQQLEQEYMQTISRPLIDELRARGLTVYEPDGLSSMRVEAPKTVIIELLNHPLVQLLAAE